MTIDDARAIYLTFPGAEEGQHHGHPDFRVSGKIFASLQPSKNAAVLRLPLELAEAQVEEDPDSRRIAGRMGGMGWLQFDVAKTNADDFLPLAEIAFNQRR